MKIKQKCLIAFLLVINVTTLSYADKTTTEENVKANETVNELLNNLPKQTDLQIEYREIVGLNGPYAWHIGKSSFWIRLHPKEKYDIEKFDKTKKYQIKGIILEQNYGMIDMWVTTIEEIR